MVRSILDTISGKPVFILLLLGLSCLFFSSLSAGMSVPKGHETFQFDLLSFPVASPDPVQTRPLGISVKGDALSVRVGIGTFPEPVDVYLGIYAPTIDGNNIYALTSGGTLQPVSETLEPWKKGTTGGISETLLSEIHLSVVTPGEYYFYVAITPAGSRDAYAFWQTSFDASPQAVTRRLSSLASLNGCDTVLTALKDRAIREMEDTIDNLISDVIRNDGCRPPMNTGFSVSAPIAPSAPPPATGTGATQYSETNVQVAGVDEADFVKNDGSFIYILADGRFQIIDAWPPQDSRVISSVAIEGEPKKLFVSSGKALVYSSLEPVDLSGPYNSPWWSFGPSSYPSGVPECTYGYDCDFTGDGKKSKITIFDISDPATPVLKRELRLSGSYLNARRIGAAVYTVATFPPPSFAGVSFWPAIMNRCWNYDTRPTKEEIVQALEQLKASNRLSIENTAVSDVLPHIEDTRYVTGTPIKTENTLANCEDFHASTTLDGQAFVSILSLNIDTNEEVKATTILGRPGAVYASPSSLYVANRQQYMPTMGWLYPITDNPPAEATTIHKFSLGSAPASSAYIGSGVVKGRVLNQFSMDEHNGYFRIATTTGHLFDPSVHSTVSVLAESKGELSLVGQVDNIAPSEDIRSARFSGDRGFVVTFKRTDPVFALDLSNPTAPKIAGELMIPGFSTYMQLMDQDHLLTIGYDAQDQGSFALLQGMMLQIFDVADMTAPRLLHKEVIGTKGTMSEAATNHLAFNYFAPRGLLAIPATICGGGFNGYTMTFSGLLVYDVSVQAGFSRRGGISHVPPASPLAPQLCGGWWAQSHSTVKRSIFMDDYVYSVALDMIKADHLGALGADVSVIDLLQK